MAVYRSSKKTLPTRAEGQVGNQNREGRVEQDNSWNCLTLVRLEGIWTPFDRKWGVIEGFEQVEQGKDVTC